MNNGKALSSAIGITLFGWLGGGGHPYKLKSAAARLRHGEVADFTVSAVFLSYKAELFDEQFPGRS